jgi:hypothetical protein
MGSVSLFLFNRFDVVSAVQLHTFFGRFLILDNQFANRLLVSRVLGPTFKDIPILKTYFEK